MNIDDLAGRVWEVLGRPVGGEAQRSAHRDLAYELKRKAETEQFIFPAHGPAYTTRPEKEYVLYSEERGRMTHGIVASPESRLYLRQAFPEGGLYKGTGRTVQSLVLTGRGVFDLMLSQRNGNILNWAHNVPIQNFTSVYGSGERAAIPLISEKIQMELVGEKIFNDYDLNNRVKEAVRKRGMNDYNLYEILLSEQDQVANERQVMSLTPLFERAIGKTQWNTKIEDRTYPVIGVYHDHVAEITEQEWKKADAILAAINEPWVKGEREKLRDKFERDQIALKIATQLGLQFPISAYLGTTDKGSLLTLENTIPSLGVPKPIVGFMGIVLKNRAGQVLGIYSFKRRGMTLNDIDEAVFDGDQAHKALTEGKDLAEPNGPVQKYYIDTDKRTEEGIF